MNKTFHLADREEISTLKDLVNNICKITPFSNNFNYNNFRLPKMRTTVENIA